jgi:uncharacterized protein YecE (DUF72 family)
MQLRIGTAGWSIPRAHAAAFPATGTHLARYAAVLPCAEINTSFYRPHRPATYARWAASVPAGFRFAVKLPRAITHEARLDHAEPLLDRFLAEATALGEALGPLLVQLPPSLPFRPTGFFAQLRARHAGDIVCEPRHPGWFTPEAEALLLAHRIARVAADPAILPAAAEPGAWPGLAYWRLHGSPRMYHSPYGPARLAPLARRLAADTGPSWVILDNTAEGHALADALHLLRGTTG